MSYHYGSDAPDIKNPFKQEGLLYLISGVIIILLGILSLITLRGIILDNGIAAGWVNLVISLVLLSGGVNGIVQGLLKISRFYVGRGVPTSLAKNMARSERHTDEPGVFYSSDEVEQMVMGRKNITFQEPINLFDRMIYSIYPKFLFLPYAMRNYLHVLTRNTGYSLIGLIVYFLALLSGTVGLTKLTESSFNDWLGIALCIFLLTIWFKKPLTAKVIHQKELQMGKNSQIGWVAVIAVIVPALSELLLRQGINFPAAPFNPTMAIVLFYLLIAAIFTVGVLLAKSRADLANPTTEVSEYRDHWQENVHPKDFFRSLDMEMANLRYREIPNRVYRELNPNLNMEGSMDKGSFSGDTIQETQPIHEEISYPPLLKKLRLGAAIGGHCLIIIAVVLLFFSKVATGVTFKGLYSIFFYPGIIWAYGAFLLNIANIYWGEMQFKSYLLQFQGEGTYSESKLSVGMAITDSTRSENTVVRTSYSPWLLVTEVISSTQAKPGANPLSNARYILSMNKADKLMVDLVNKINKFLDEKEVIAAAASKGDSKNIEAFYAINDANKASTEKLQQLKKSGLLDDFEESESDQTARDKRRDGADKIEHETNFEDEGFEHQG